MATGRWVQLSSEVELPSAKVILQLCICYHLLARFTIDLHSHHKFQVWSFRQKNRVALFVLLEHVPTTVPNYFYPTQFLSNLSLKISHLEKAENLLIFKQLFIHTPVPRACVSIYPCSRSEHVTTRRRQKMSRYLYILIHSCQLNYKAGAKSLLCLMFVLQMFLSTGYMASR